MKRRDRGRVLALYPTTRGFGFALFDAKQRLVDWGVTGIRESDKNGPTLRAIERLIDRLEPAIIVCEDARASDSRRHARIRQLLRDIDARAARRKITTYRFSRRTVRHYFGIRTKRELTLMLASAYPALAARVPPTRRPWMSEDARQSLFDAVALAVVCFAALDGEQKQEPDIPA